MLLTLHEIFNACRLQGKDPEMCQVPSEWWGPLVAELVQIPDTRGTPLVFEGVQIMPNPNHELSIRFKEEPLRV